MRTLLVNTNRMKPAVAPLGLDYLADALVAAGHQPRLLDLCFSDHVDRDIAQALRTEATDVVGVTVRNTDDCYFSGRAFFLPGIKKIIEQFRRHSEAPVVVGGVGFSVSPVAAFEYCGADFGIAGEGEQAFVALLHTLQDGADFGQVPGLLYREAGLVRANPPQPVDLATLPVRTRSFVDNALYFRKGGQAGFETKRGCPMHCVYCAEPAAKGRIVREMPPARVAAELSSLLAQGIDHFHTCDSEFNLPRAHALAVCKAMIDAGLGNRIRWYAYCTPAPFDEELAGLMRRAGCAGIDFGADSGCDEMLTRLGRPFTTADLAHTARICRLHGIPFMFDLLLGAPGETMSTLRRTLDFVRSVEPDCVGLSLGVRLYESAPVTTQIRAQRDPAHNPDLYGATRDNPRFLEPVFYVSPEVGGQIVRLVREHVAGDPRFFLPEDSDANANYNYNDNADLVHAIEEGARGAYWDILRRQRVRSATERNP